MGNFETQNLASMAWAITTTNEYSMPLFAALAVLASAANCKSNELLFAALARALRWSMGSFIAQHLANAAWAFVSTCNSHTPLIAALARALAGRVGNFNAQHLANTAWASVTACKSNAPSFFANAA